MNSSSLASLVAAAALAVVASSPTAAPAAQGDCSQPVSTGQGPTATDCLFILQVTVAIQTCDPDPCVCAPKGTLPPAATDALICLQVATGAGGTLNCPCQTSNACEDGEAPTCGGECEEGGICAPDPQFPSDCECLSECEAAEAPTCNASCEDEDPEASCLSIRITSPGQAPLDACVCLPPDAGFCTDASAPDCEGICGPGTACAPAAFGGDCQCVSQPPQGACTQASSPTCAGTCPDGFICEDEGGQCGCAEFTGQEETCFDADGPTCGGTCAFGEQCAVDFAGECECFDACEVSAAPACGGACPEGDGSCVVRTVAFGASSVDFCECIPD